MTMRLIKTVQGTDGKTVKVYWNSQMQEYIARLLQDGQPLIDSDYFTDSKEDAIWTAQRMAD